MIDIRNALAAIVAALALCGLASASDLAEGEVRKVDKEGKKLTLKHGPLKNLDMPGMTMVFQVKEDALLDKVQAGDKVRFQAEKIDGKFTVIRLEAAR
jgi:Cu(I)/Ag(I) efflux system protein CusF